MCVFTLAWCNAFSPLKLLHVFRSKKPCKYFDQGRGTCPFGGKCFYMHAYPDGTRAEPDKPRKQLSSEGNVRVTLLIKHY